MSERFKWFTGTMLFIILVNTDLEHRDTRDLIREQCIVQELTR